MAKENLGKARMEEQATGVKGKSQGSNTTDNRPGTSVGGISRPRAQGSSTVEEDNDSLLFSCEESDGGNGTADQVRMLDRLHGRKV